MNIKQIASAPDGSPIYGITLASETMQARIISFGAALQDLRLDGIDHPLTLGFRDAARYANNPDYLGAVVGRLANRISGASFTIDDRTYALDRNEAGKTCLHGGQDGTSNLNWTVTDTSASHATLQITLPDGHMGFPGQLEISVTYALQGDTLTVSFSATTDAPTVCNLAPHLYFNLDGTPDISNHLLSISADRMIPTKEGLPSSDPVSVKQLGMDLRTPSQVPLGVDHNFCTGDTVGALRPVAMLSTADVSMQIATTEPGLQIYDGTGLNIVAEGLDGRSYGTRAGVAIEPQRWIDAPNQPWRDQTDLGPGQTYTAVSEFRFIRT